MRLKIILANAIVVAMVAVLAFVVLRLKLTSLDDSGAVKNDVELVAKSAAGNMQLQLLRAERWLTENGSTDALRERLNNLGLEDKGRRASATQALDTLKRAAGDAKGTFDSPPDVVAIVDKEGKAIGRSDDAQTYTGEDFGSVYPALKAAIAGGHSGSDIWLSSKFAHKHMASYAPVRDATGNVVGGVVILWSLTEARITKFSSSATALVVVENGAPKVWARSNEAAAPGFAQELEGAQKDIVLRAIKNGSDSQAQAGGLAEGVAVLSNVGDGQKAALAVARKTSQLPSAMDFLGPLGLAALLGLTGAALAGWILGSYVTEPVGRMEETLLQVINGNTNARIELEHAELGGLAFRINQLLNTVLGVEEDDTDDEGRPSAPPAREHFQEALQVDRGAGGADAASLAAEPEGAYYGRIYREYIEAKQANGEKVDGITEEVFTNRIKGMEKEQSAKLGKAVRYVVQRRDNQVLLQPVPLG